MLYVHANFFEDLIITFSQWKQQHQNAVKRFDITIIVVLIIIFVIITLQSNTYYAEVAPQRCS